MAPETRLAVRSLFKKIALVCILLGIVAGLSVGLLPDPGMQLLVLALVVLAAGGCGYRFASTVPLWAATPWLKGVMCVLAILAGIGTVAVAGTVSLFGYVIATGASGSGGSSRHFDSWD